MKIQTGNVEFSEFEESSSIVESVSEYLSTCELPTSRSYRLENSGSIQEAISRAAEVHIQSHSQEPFTIFL